MTLTPTQIAEKLRDSGHHEAALEVALAALADGAPTTPAAPDGAAATEPLQRGWLTLEEIRKLTAPEAEALRKDHPDVYRATLEHLDGDGPVPREQLMDLTREDLQALKARDPKLYEDSMATLVRGSR